MNQQLTVPLQKNRPCREHLLWIYLQQVRGVFVFHMQISFCREQFYCKYAANKLQQTSCEQVSANKTIHDPHAISFPANKSTANILWISCLEHPVNKFLWTCCLWTKHWRFTCKLGLPRTVMQWIYCEQLCREYLVNSSGNITWSLKHMV